jgi:transcriptional regulator with GAF, ATPase, and Fis domain
VIDTDISVRLLRELADAHTANAIDRIAETIPISKLDKPTRALVAQAIETARAQVAVIERLAAVSRRAHVEGRELRADIDRLTSSSFVARSPVMRAVLERALIVARHPTTVLLTGESGTGKEVLSREIHRHSPRARRPLLQINCGAIPSTLVESELFGHERGAFTGADRTHRGIFERAHGGTLLLDEIGDLPKAAQAKLLRVLQERRIRRVGGTDPIDVDVRVIAATHRPLAELVQQGEFREDLFYRINVFSIELPPLRERREDVPLLVNAILTEIAERLGIEPPGVPRSVMARLQAHAWPGNVRELANVLEAGVILATDGTLAVPPDFAVPSARGESAFDAAVRSAIEAALRATRGKIYGRDGAAARLGLKPGTLQSKMVKLGIARRRFVA